VESFGQAFCSGIFCKLNDTVRSGRVQAVRVTGWGLGIETSQNNNSNLWTLPLPSPPTFWRAAVWSKGRREEGALPTYFVSLILRIFFVPFFFVVLEFELWASHIARQAVYYLSHASSPIFCLLLSHSINYDFLNLRT
jgi:hypothetical protein